MKGWQIISYVIQKPVYPSGLSGGGEDLQAGSAALRPELRLVLCLDSPHISYKNLGSFLCCKVQLIYFKQ